MIRLLAVDADVPHPAAVRLDELLRLDEHAAGAAAGIIDAAMEANDLGVFKTG